MKLWTFREIANGKPLIEEWTDESASVANVYTDQSRAEEDCPADCEVREITFKELSREQSSRATGEAPLYTIYLDRTIMDWPHFVERFAPPPP